MCCLSQGPSRPLFLQVQCSYIARALWWGYLWQFWPSKLHSIFHTMSLPAGASLGPQPRALPCLYKRVSIMPRERLGSASLKKKKSFNKKRKNKLNNPHLLDKQLVRSQGISVSFLQSFPQFFFFFLQRFCLPLSFFSSLCSFKIKFSLFWQADKRFLFKTSFLPPKAKKFMFELRASGIVGIGILLCYCCASASHLHKHTV